MWWIKIRTFFKCLLSCEKHGSITPHDFKTTTTQKFIRPKKKKHVGFYGVEWM